MKAVFSCFFFISKCNKHFLFQLDLYQREYFLQEFRRTQICSFLCFLNDLENFDRLFTEESGQDIISIDLIYNCIKRVEYNIKVKQHLSIDLERTTNCSTFNEMAKQIDMIVYQQKKIKYPEFLHNFSMEKLKTNIKVIVR
jgi:hypothetical protein